MSVLVLADHDNASLKPATLNAIAAAAKLGPVHVLVAGHGCDGAAAAFLPARGATCLGVGAVFSFGDAFYFFGCALGISRSIVSPCLRISAWHAAMFTSRTAAS